MAEEPREAVKQALRTQQLLLRALQLRLGQRYQRLALAQRELQRQQHLSICPGCLANTCLASLQCSVARVLQLY